MRDLAARLREIVRRPTGAAGAPAVRELTYVPDPDPSRPMMDAAARLGGRTLDSAGACVVIDRLFPLDRSHGRRSIEWFAPAADRPLHLFDARLANLPEWWRRVVFFDTETTGLSGGAGTLAFLAGCGWFEAEGFRVRQFFLTAPGGERPMLDAFGALLSEASLLVTYNGRTFDVPLMETRWAFHRTPAATDDVPHFDMLPAARRLWRGREAASDADAGCSLSTLECAVLGFHRGSDVPGFEIPARYFQFLRTGDAGLIEGVLDHNRHDLVSLAGVMAQALWLAAEGPDACREPSERMGLGRLYERAGEVERAERAFEAAAAAGHDVETRRQALGHLAIIRRRNRRFEDAARAWEEILALAPASRRVPSPLERRAREALAIHQEHRAKDLVAARRHAEALGAEVAGRQRSDVNRRIERLDRKLRTQPVPNLRAWDAPGD